jgi:hypothetical protein
MDVRSTRTRRRIDAKESTSDGARKHVAKIGDKSSRVYGAL